VTTQSLNVDILQDLTRKVFVGELMGLIFVSIHIWFLFKSTLTIDFIEKNGNYKTGNKLKNDLCDILGSGKVVRNPLVSAILTMVKKFGRFPRSCPIKKVKNTILHIFLFFEFFFKFF
jgi:Protein of unknown function (DUF1091)